MARLSLGSSQPGDQRPEEEEVDHQQGQGEHEDQDRPARPFADRQRGSRQEDDGGQREDQAPAGGSSAA